jgi:hypothetical protein
MGCLMHFIATLPQIQSRHFRAGAEPLRDGRKFGAVTVEKPCRRSPGSMSRLVPALQCGSVNHYDRMRAAGAQAIGADGEPWR